MQTNIARGALPPDGLFRTARSASTIAVLVGVVFIYLAGNRLGGALTGWLAAFLLGSNALVLLHGRRAMSEGTLIFAVCFAIWGMFLARKHPWLAGLSLALAVNSKHSVVVLVPVSLLAVLWPGEDDRLEFKSAFWKLGQFLGVFIMVTYALNPMIWRYPFQAVPEMVRERAEWMELQISTLQAFELEDQIIDTLPEKIFVTSANLFIRPLSFYEIGNYAEDTAASEAVYNQIPGHNFLRGMISGGILFVLTLTGFAVGAIQAIKGKLSAQRELALLLLATVILGGALVWAVFLTAQRYVIPLVPFSSLWIAYFIGDIVEKVKAGTQKPPKVVSA